MPNLGRTNLPLQLTSFIGREHEIAEIKRLLGNARLLTLTGSGGCGKTRLAIQAAGDLLDKFPDGVWLVEFASLADPVLVPPTLASLFDLQVNKNLPLIDTLKLYFRPKNLLLVLDNCEHVIDACAELADRLLRACPTLQMLATSREPLNIAGETSFRVPSLALPNILRSNSLDELAHSESIRLFVERAAAARPEFGLTEANGQLVAQICQQLDGMPLAIELAAARVKTFGVDQIAERLDDRFRLLTNGNRTALPRQQTLAATIDWSHNLLSMQERLLFLRLSVFAGGWTLETAENVCAGDDISSHDVLNLLSRLIDQSLVIVEESHGVRYRFLETIRQYARNQLVESGETNQWQVHHLECFVKLAEQSEPELKSARQLDWLNRLEAEHDNLRAALRFGIESNHVTDALRLASAVWRFWNVRGYWTEGRQWLTRALAQYSARDAIRAKALQALGMLCWFNEDIQASYPHIEASLAVARELGDKRRIAEALVALGLFYGRSGIRSFNKEMFAKARQTHESSLALWRELDDPWGIAESLMYLGFANKDLGDPETARTLQTESLAKMRALGDQWGVTWSLFDLGYIALVQGDLRLAAIYFEESNTIAEKVGERRLRLHSFVHLVDLANYLGNYDLARSWAEKQLRWAQSIGDSSNSIDAFIELGKIAYLQGDHVQAMAHWDEGLAIAREINRQDQVARFHAYKGYAVQALGDFRQALELFKASLKIDLEASNSFYTAHDFAALGGIATSEGQIELALHLFAIAETLAASTGRPLWSRNKSNAYARLVVLERDVYDRDLATLKATISDAKFAQLWAEGCAFTLEQAIGEINNISVLRTVGANPNQITPREMDVLQLLIRGLSNQQIADQMMLSRRTVDAHLRSIYSKLNVTTRSGAIHAAQEQKLI